MGLGGPLGGFISDRYGWRWAFLIQLPIFALSLVLTTVNLRYPTPVSPDPLNWTADRNANTDTVVPVQGKNTSASEALKRIDYGGIFSLLGAVSVHA